MNPIPSLRLAGLALGSLLLLLQTGCGTLPGGRRWGEDAVYPVTWERVGKAARNAVLDPVTWVTAGGAAIFAIDDFDQRVSHWASERTPLFGSQRTADDLSTVFRDTLRAEVYLTLALTPSGDDPLEWGLAKARGGAVEYLAMRATAWPTSWLKDEVGRERPDGSSDSSFPSGHASAAFSSLRLANRNLDAMDIPAWARTSLKAGNHILAGGSAWARVEAKRHYPSDVLVGAALGNLVTTFIHDAFMNLPEDSTFSFYLEPSPRGVMAGMSWDF
jgi:membrane-associated phospholipid phosphatase